MANMMALNTVYNHYLTTYADSLTSGRYDTHKKSELKDIYNRIVKLNKESPLFLPVTGSETRAFAIEVKEGARNLHNVISSLGGMDTELLNKRAAISDNEDIISVNYIGHASIDEDVPSYEIEVKSLATCQTNLGNFLPEDGKPGLPEGTYSFDIDIHNTNYEFQYNITEDDTNRSLQEKLARLINRADIGIDADVVEDEDTTSLRLMSQATGAPVGRDDAFSVTDDNSSKLSGSVGYFGIGEIARPATDAELVINGIERSVSSNHFTLEHTYDLTLKGISPESGDTVSVGVMSDTDSLAENINRLVDGYNSFVDSASGHPGAAHTRGSHLLDEMRRIALSYSESLNSIGFELDQNGHISMNRDLGEASSLNLSNPREAAGTMKNFAGSLLRKANQISLDPMQYIDKVMVAYKNPQGKNYPTPYITSAYSGMLFNGYC